MLIETDRLHRVGVVVRNLEQATARYAEIFGLDVWEVRELGADELTDVHAHGRAIGVPRLRTATCTSVPPTDKGWGGGAAGNVPVTFELVQPFTGESTFMEFRFVRRQGISHLHLATMTNDEYAATRDALAARGIGEAMAITVDGRVRRHFLDTRAALGGYVLEIDVPLVDDADAPVAETWDLRGSCTRPDGVGPVAIFGVNHFGIVVDDVMASIERYHNLLGASTWTIRDWRTESGSLECPYYRGDAVDHEYLTALSPFRDFGFEVIQPTHGPSHYNREFQDRWGEGIHHMLLNMSTDTDDWDRVRDWLATIDVPVVMGGGLAGGAAEFCYYDTTDALGGYILEAFLLKSMPSGPAADSTDYVIDFAAVTAQLPDTP